MEPIVLFGIQFTCCLVAYTLIALWYGMPRLLGLPRELALVPLLWIHVFRIVGGTSEGIFCGFLCRYFRDRNRVSRRRFLSDAPLLAG